MQTLNERWIDAGGHNLYVIYGNRPEKRMVLFLHGYPDSHRVWREIMIELDDAYFVVSFDLRGVAGSGPPAPPQQYRIATLIEDIDLVIKTLGGDRAHLVGHDWGSTIGWSYVTDAEYGVKVDSWTSISGPHLGIWMNWVLKGLKSLDLRRTGAVLSQLFKSSYVLFLLAWPLPEIVWQLGGVRLWQWVLRRAGVPEGDAMLDESREYVLSMTLRPMALYRQNVFRPPKAPPLHSVSCPVQLLIPTKDPFVSEVIYGNLDDYVNKLTIEKVNASHWAPRSHRSEVIQHIRQFLRANTGAR